jgi:hypothetical protein
MKIIAIASFEIPHTFGMTWLWAVLSLKKRSHSEAQGNEESAGRRTRSQALIKALFNMKIIAIASFEIPHCVRDDLDGEYL